MNGNVEANETPLERAYRLGEGPGGLDARGVRRLIELGGDGGGDGHDCVEHAVPVLTDGPLGHGWECARCGAFLQAG